MGEDGIKKNESGSGSIEEVMRERGRLDQIIHEKFRRKMAILFSDICDFTKYMDTRGDIAGRAWVQKHHDIVLPLIKKHEGKILDIMGDGILASFSTTLSAVKTSIAIQKALEEYNKKTDSADNIHVSMGINTGEVLFDKEQVAGDTVNVASRIESYADRDQILISRSAYEDVRGSDDVLCRSYGSVMVKGKAVPLDLYRVVWQDEDIVIGYEPRTRAREDKVKKRVKPPSKILQLEITREEDRLKISAYEQAAGEVNTIRRYEEIPVSIEKIGTRCREVIETLNKVNRRGRMTREVLVRLREIGQVFADELFTLDVKEKVKETGADHLILNLDDQLVHVPWELLHDGSQFLCQRFNMGRLVKTRQTVQVIRNRVLARPLKMLVLADPRGDLKGAYDEGTEIRNEIDKIDKNEKANDFINVSLHSDNITPDYIKQKIRNFDFVHFAGHSDYNTQDPAKSGWRLSSGTMEAREIVKMAGTAAMPALIFSNACQSARTEEWNIKEHFQDEIFGLANAFILAGVKHYVGTFWEILDEPSRRFALEFYRNLFSEEMSVGESIRRARKALIGEYGEESIVWASYLLYGDPTSNYMDQLKGIAVEEEKKHVSVPPGKAEGKTRDREVDDIIFPKGEPKVKKTRWLPGLLFLMALVAFLLWGYPGFIKYDPLKREDTVMTYYKGGNFEEALNRCKDLVEKSPKRRLAYLVQGHIYLRRGDLEQAKAIYQGALQATKGTETQKAEAFIGLGRIASIEKRPEEALKYYEQATAAAPGSRQGYLSQALLLDKRGDYEGALALLDKSRTLGPENQLVAALTQETREKAAVTGDQKRQEKIDKLIKELIESMNEPPRASPTDGWTSPPLTLWFMDFKIRGYSLQEGEDRLMASGITDQLIKNSPVQVVERAILDKVLEELKLGTSALTDRGTALSLGKILAARLILSGQIVYSGPHTQISMRLIETETAKISAAINESFGSAVPLTAVTDRLSESLLRKIKELYPLRGKISDLKEGEVELNIGRRTGVRKGQHFAVKDTGLALEIMDVQTDTSTAKVVQGNEALQKGLRVEAL